MEVMPFPKSQLTDVMVVLLVVEILVKPTGSPIQRLAEKLMFAFGDSTKVATKDLMLAGQLMPITAALDKVMVTLPADTSPGLGKYKPPKELLVGENEPVPELLQEPALV